MSTNKVFLAILQDPVMQSILNQAKNDPAALQNHMQNATIRMKIQKVSIFSNPSYRGHRLTMMES